MNDHKAGSSETKVISGCARNYCRHAKIQRFYSGHHRLGTFNFGELRRAVIVAQNPPKVFPLLALDHFDVTSRIDVASYQCRPCAWSSL